MFVGQAAGWETAVLQYAIAIAELVTFDPSFAEKVKLKHMILSSEIEGILLDGKLKQLED